VAVVQIDLSCIAPSSSSPAPDSPKSPSPRPLYPDTNDQACRHAKYGCPSRRKQLECLAAASRLIQRHAQISGVSGRVLQL